MESDEGKVYSFTIAKAGQDEERVDKLEHELTERDKDFLLGNLVNEFNKCPDDVKLRFIELLIQEFASGENTET